LKHKLLILIQPSCHK